MVFYIKTNLHILSNRAHFFLEWKMFQTKFVEKIETHFVLKYWFRKSWRLRDNVEKYCRAGQATENMMHAHSMLDS
jgi:hypothetical protein